MARDPKRRFLTLEQLSLGYAAATVSELREAEGDEFLVCTAGLVNVPTGPMETAKLSPKLLDALARGEPTPLSPVFAIQPAGTSPYSFITLGRTPNCDVYVHDASVSKLHAMFRIHDGRLHVQDAGSENGTFIDDGAAPTAGTGAPLLPGVTVRFGEVVTRYVQAAGLHALLRRYAPEAALASTEAGAAAERRHVLIVDDDVAIRTALARALGEAGFEVTTVASPFDACLLAIRHSPALVLVDYRLPGMNGGRVCQSIKQVRPAQRVVLMSSVDEGELATLAERSGADGHIHKGARPDGIVRWIVDQLAE